MHFMQVLRSDASSTVEQSFKVTGLPAGSRLRKSQIRGGFLLCRMRVVPGEAPVRNEARDGPQLGACA